MKQKRRRSATVRASEAAQAILLEARAHLTEIRRGFKASVEAATDAQLRERYPAADLGLMRREIADMPADPGQSHALDAICRFFADYLREFRSDPYHSVRLIGKARRDSEMASSTAFTVQAVIRVLGGECEVRLPAKPGESGEFRITLAGDEHRIPFSMDGDEVGFAAATADLARNQAEAASREAHAVAAEEQVVEDGPVAQRLLQ